VLLPDDLREKTFAYLKPSLASRYPPGLVVERNEQPVLRNLNNGLLVAYVIEREKGFRYIQSRDLDVSGIEEPELHECGVRNLAKFARTNLRVERCGAVFATFLDGNFEASLLLIDRLWDHELTSFVGDRVTVTVPARDVLAFCDATSSEGLAQLRQIARKTTEVGDHSLTPVLYRRHQRKWAPLI